MWQQLFWGRFRPRPHVSRYFLKQRVCLRFSSLRASSPIWASEASLARSRETGFTRPNRRACSQATVSPPQVSYLNRFRLSIRKRSNEQNTKYIKCKRSANFSYVSYFSILFQQSSSINQQHDIN